MRIDVSNALGERLLDIAKKEGLDTYAREQVQYVSEAALRNVTMGKVVNLLAQRYADRHPEVKS